MIDERKVLLHWTTRAADLAETLARQIAATGAHGVAADLEREARECRQAIEMVKASDESAAAETPLTYAAMLAEAREDFQATLGLLEERDEASIREAFDEAIDDVIPSMNETLAAVLMRDLKLGFPADKDVFEEGDIFSAIRLSIRESLTDDLRHLLDEAIEGDQENPDDARDDEQERRQLRSEFVGDDE